MKIFDNYSRQMILIGVSIFAVFLVGCSSGVSTPRDAPATSTTIPTVTATAPLDGATGVALNTKVLAQFSTPMEPSTLSGTTFTLVGPGTTPVAGSVTYVKEAATFTPTNNLAPDTVYTATVTKGAKSLSGVAMAADYTWSFKTGLAIDDTSPYVDFTDPVSNASSVPINRNITATFNEVIDPATVNNTTFTLHASASNEQVTGSASSLGSTAVFEPTNDLASGTAHTATLTTGITDLAANAMASDYTWGFTTGAIVENDPPPVNLGTAINYAVLSEASVATISGSTVTGHVGLSPALRASLTGWGETYDDTITFATSTQVVAPYRIYISDMTGGTTASDLSTAVVNMQTAYADAAGRTATSAETTDVGSGTLTGITLTPGVYEWATAVGITGPLTFEGSATDVWILKVDGALGMTAGQSIILSGGALPKNIFWQVS